MSLDGELLGAAGDNLVAAMLSLRGWQIAPTARGASRTDLLAQRPDRTGCAIQVKTRSSGDFHVGAGALEASPPNTDEWFVLVSCPTPIAWPSVNIVPRNHLVAAARVLQADREADGKAWSRKCLGEAEFAGYRDDWSLMERAAWLADWRMPDWVTNGLRVYPQADLQVPPST